MNNFRQAFAAANGLGQESMAHSVTGCMWQQADFPADAFLSRGTGTTRKEAGVHHKHERCT